MIFLRLRNLFRLIFSKINILEYNYYKARQLYIEVPIVELSSIGEKIGVFKEATVEQFDYIKTYDFFESGRFDIIYPEIDVWKIKNALVFHSTDFVVTSGGYCAWPKYYLYNYSKNIATDAFLVKEKNGLLTYKKPHKVLDVNTAFSLIGVCAHVWAHAIAEYLPKLSMLSTVIKDSKERITVLIPEYNDVQLSQVMSDQLKKYDVDILTVHKDEAVNVQTLYYMQRPTIFTDHEINVSPGDQVLPKAVINVLKRDLVAPYKNNLQIDPRYKKIFLSRRGGYGKGIINQEEIEQYFEKMGFVFVEPHKVCLEEKVKIFHSAEVIAGPLGSAFTNIIFCNPGTKVLLFSNFQRIFDYYVGCGQQYFGLEMMMVNGWDDKTASNMSHCSYYIPIERVIGAAKKMKLFENE